MTSWDTEKAVAPWSRSTPPYVAPKKPWGSRALPATVNLKSPSIPNTRSLSWRPEGILDVPNVIGEGVFWVPRGPRCLMGAGYIRRKNEGTFGYIRVHSGTFGYIRVHSPPLPGLPDTHENQRILGSTLFALGTFAACTHPFYKTKKGGTVFVCVRAGSGETVLPSRNLQSHCVAPCCHLPARSWF